MEKNKGANAKASSLSFPRFNGLHLWYGQDERFIWIKVYDRIKWERNISCTEVHLSGVVLTLHHSETVLRKGIPKAQVPPLCSRAALPLPQLPKERCCTWDHYTPPQLLIVLFVQQIWLKYLLWSLGWFCALTTPGFCVPAPGWAKCSCVYTAQKGKWIHPGMLLSTRMGAQHRLSIAQASPLGSLLSLYYSFWSQLLTHSIYEPQALVCPSTARLCGASLALAAPVHVQSFLWSVCALPPPQPWPNSSAWHLAHGRQNENSELFKTFFAVSDDLQHPKTSTESKRHSQGCWLLSVLRCQWPRGNTMSVFRLGTPALRQGLELGSRLGRFWWQACGCKNQCVPGAISSIRPWNHGKIVEHSAPTEMDMFKNCIYKLLSSSGSIFRINGYDEDLVSKQGSWSIYKHFCDVSIPKHLCCQYFLFYENFLFPTTNSLMTCFHTEE